MPSEKDKFFLKWLEEKFKGLDEKIEANTALTKEVRKEQKSATKRLDKLDNAVFTDAKLPPFYRDPKVIQIILYVALAFLLLVAAVTKFDIRSLL